jgi:peptide/nickel transport system substrate-binding protein
MMMNIGKRVARYALGIALAAGPIAAAHAQGNAAGDANPNAALIYFDAAGNETLDPAEPQNNSTFSHEVLLAVFDTLIQLKADGTPIPGLAESWTRNADLTEITLKLRPNVTFHDGAPFNADAVKRNLERSIALGKRAGATMSETVAAIEAIETPDPLTVRLKLKAPSGQIEYWLAANAGMMLSPAALGDAGAMGNGVKPIGAGPYKVKSFEPNVRTVMTRNDSYWGGTTGRPASFEHHYVPDGRARLNALRSGQANIALIDPRQIQEAKGAGLQVQVNEKNAIWDIYPNTKKAHLDDIRVRRAIMHALDREALAEALGFGSARPTQQFFAAASPFFVPALQNRYPYDPDKAKALLAEAGLKDGLDINMLLLNNSEYRQLAEAVQAMLAEVNIRVKFDVVDVSQFPLFFRQPPRGDILMARYAGRSDPLQSLFELAGTGGSYAPGGAVAPVIDELIGKLKRMPATDPARVPMFQALAKEINENVATLPIITRANVYAYRPGCIIGLESYLSAGDDKFNDVRVGAKCK